MGHHDREPKTAASDQANEHELPPVTASASAPSPTQVNRMLAAPDRIDLGEAEVGRVARHEELFFNLARNAEAFVDARITGDAAVILERVPSVLRPSGEHFDPTKTFGFALQPTRKGHVAATLTVSTTWGAGGPANELTTIPVVGGGHVAGAPTLAEEETEAAEQERLAAEDKAQEVRIKKQDQVVDDFLKTDFHVHAGDRQKLDDQTKRAEIALQTLFETRKLGVETARAEIDSYSKQIVQEDPSLASQLGWMALQAFGVAVTGHLSAALGPLIASAMSTTYIDRVPEGPIHEHTSTPPEALVDLITQSIKEIGKLVVKKNVQKWSDPGTHVAQQQPASVTDHGFFESQVSALIEQNATKASATTIRLHDVLLSQLTANPRGVIKAMGNIADAVTREATLAKDEQALHTEVHWLSYVAQQGRGRSQTSKDGNGHVANPRSFTGAFDREHPVDRVAGLVDIRFKASSTDPTAPVSIESVRVDGVSAAVIETVNDRPLSSLPVAVRAVSKFDEPSLSVTVVRNEDGGVAWTDNSTGGIGFTNWLSRRAGHHDDSVTSQMEGARKLMDKDMLPKSLRDLAPGGAIGNDSDA